jgi:hypothetical protein
MIDNKNEEIDTVNTEIDTDNTELDADNLNSNIDPIKDILSPNAIEIVKMLIDDRIMLANSSTDSVLEEEEEEKKSSSMLFPLSLIGLTTVAIIGFVFSNRSNFDKIDNGEQNNG